MMDFQGHPTRGQVILQLIALYSLSCVAGDVTDDYDFALTLDANVNKNILHISTMRRMIYVLQRNRI